MDRLFSTLEQWRMALAVADAGGFARAARQLNKSQSAVSHGVGELSQRLGLAIFEIHGREARLSSGGEVLLRRARRLLADAQQLEQMAATIARGQETSLTIAIDAIDAIVPVGLVIGVLEKFSDLASQTRVEVREVVLSGILDAMEAPDASAARRGGSGGGIGGNIEGGAVLGLSAIVPPGLSATPLVVVEFIGVSHRDHPLQHLGRPLENADLSQHRHLVVADTGRRRYEASWQATGQVETDQRWTFSNHASSLEALKSGHGFTWLPKDRIEAELAAGLLKPLAMAQPQRRRTVVQLVHGERETLGPAANLLIDLFLAEQQPGITENTADVIRTG